MDETIASILRDLEFAEKSLQSTSYLLDEDSTLIDNTPRKTETADVLPFLDCDPNRSKYEYIDEDLNSSGEPIVDNVSSTIYAQELMHLYEQKESYESVEHIKKEADLHKETSQTMMTVNVECNSKDQLSVEIPQNSLKCPEGQTGFKIPIPSTNPYINFVQDFIAKFTDQEATASMLVALAMTKWRNMGKEEKQVYNNIRLNCEKNIHVKKLKDYIETMKMSEESLFHDFNV